MSKVAVTSIALALLTVVATATASAHGDRLTPAETKWVKPLLTVWNVQNAGLRVVIKQATAKNALIAGSEPNNLALTKTLAALLTCKVPVDEIKRAGAPPSPQLDTFRESLNAACIHDQNGANDFAKAIGAVSKKEAARARALLEQGGAQFKKGSVLLTKAYKSLVALAG